MDKNQSNNNFLCLHGLPTPTIVTDHAGVIIFANNTFASFSGIELDKLIGTQVFSIFQRDDTQVNQDIFEQQPTQNQLLSSSCFANLATDRVLPVTVSKALIDSGQKNEPAWLWSCTDLTEKKESKAKTDLQQDTYLGILNHLKDAVFIQDERGTFLMVNNTASVLYGYPQEELIGKSPRDLSAGNQNDFDEINQKVQHCINGEKQQLQFWGKKRSGIIFPTEVMLNPGMFFNQKVAIAIVNDITQLQNAAREIKHGEEKYKMLLDNAFDAIYLTKGHRFQYVNKRFTEITGYQLDEVLHPDFDFDQTLTHKSRLLLAERTQKRQQGEAVDPTYLLQLKDKINTIHDVEISTVIVSQSTDIEVLGIMRDVTTLLNTNKKLEWGKTFFENIYANVPYGILLLDEFDHVVDANNAFIEIFQWKLDELKGNPINDFIVPDTRKAEGMQYTHDVSVGLKIEVETIRQRKDGTQLHVKIIGKPAKLPNGDQLVFGIYQDITERIVFNTEIKQQKHYFEQLFQSIPYGIVLVDMQATIQDCNEAFEALFYFKNNELIGKSIDVIMPKDLVQEGIDMRAKVAAGENVYNETTRLRKDGQVVDVAVTAKLLTNPEGQQFILAVFQDITDRKLVEGALQYERNLMEALMTNIPDNIYFKDTNSQFIRINQSQARALGVEKPDDAVGKSDFDFFNKELAAKSFDDEQKIFQNGNFLINAQEHIKTAHGWRWFSATKVPMFDMEGQIFGLAGVSRDITEIKNLENTLLEGEEHLRLLNAEKDKLFSIIAHDLRSPFSSFLMLTEMLTNDSVALEPAETKKLIVSMYKSASNLYDLLENLLSWSRLQRGLTPFDPLNIRLSDTITNCLENFTANINRKELKITVNVPDDLVVMADLGLLSSIMRNLLSNAIKFTPNGGSIIISSRYTSDKQVIVSIQDTGIGMSETLQQSLFSIELKGRKGTEGEPSSGLGLILAKDFVEKQGGQLTLESEENKGSTFSFSLNVA